MSFYICTYMRGLTEDALGYLESMDIAQRVQTARSAEQIFGRNNFVGYGTDKVFMFKANNYEEAMQFILKYKSMVEAGYNTHCTLGNWAGNMRNEVAKNKLHLIKCKNGDLTDIAAYFRITEADKKRIVGLSDAVTWLKRRFGDGFYTAGLEDNISV